MDNFTWPKDGMVIIVAVKGKMWGATVDPMLREKFLSGEKDPDLFEKCIVPALRFIENEIAIYQSTELKKVTKKVVSEKFN